MYLSPKGLTDIRDVPIRSVGSVSGRSGHFSADRNQQFWTWTQAQFKKKIIYVRAQFVAESRHMCNVTLVNLWIKCLHEEIT